MCIGIDRPIGASGARRLRKGALALLAALVGCDPIALRSPPLVLADGRPCNADGECASGRCRSATCAGTWPEGALGDLVVREGTVLEVPAGSILDYSSITVEEHARIELLPGDGWTVIGCRGTFRLDGELLAERGTDCRGVLERTTPPRADAPTGEHLVFEVAQAAGGAGGEGGVGIAFDANGDRFPNTERPLGGGAPTCGNGGGGGGGHHSQFVNFAKPGGDAVETEGGSGGASGPIPGGAGAALFGASGGVGVSGDNFGRWPQSGLGGGGGGGGSRGYHGQAIFLQVHTIVGTGFIRANGQPGGDGGGGGSGTFWQNAYKESSAGGGGGGGGAGGSGGAVVLRYQVRGDDTILSHVETLPGPGGHPGGGGGNGGGVASGGLEATAGQPGSQGTFDPHRW